MIYHMDMEIDLGMDMHMDINMDMDTYTRHEHSCLGQEQLFKDLDVGYRIWVKSVI
jgi:hypothetical protein